MDVRRFFVNKSDVSDGILYLTGEEFYHATKVIRLKKGFLFVATAGDGVDYDCRVIEIGADRLTAEILSETKNETEMRTRLTLFQAVLKNNKLDDVVQKSVELGAAAVVPFYSEFTSADGSKTDRLKKIALEACKQCGRARLVSVSEPIKFDDLAEAIKAFDRVYFFYERAELNTLADSISPTDRNVAVIIGSEGGFSASEAERLKRAANVVTVGLGKRILRADTAAVAALTLVSYLMGEME